jgi:hypothetical protein
MGAAAREALRRSGVFELLARVVAALDTETRDAIVRIGTHRRAVAVQGAHGDS